MVPDAPWVITDAFLEQHDIDFVCHDALPYVVCTSRSGSGRSDVHRLLQCNAGYEQLGKFRETQVNEYASTNHSGPIVLLAAAHGRRVDH